MLSYSKTLLFLCLYILLYPCQNIECTRPKSWVFETDLTKDSQESTYLENYMEIQVNSQNETFENVTYCFRWQLNNWLPHCLFREKNLGFFLSNPKERFGFIYINGLEFMFKLKYEMTPYLWYHICIAYESNNYAIKMFVNGDNILDRQLSVLEATSKGIRIASDMVLGSCREFDSDDPHKKISRVRLQDFNMWSIFLSDDEMIKFTASCHIPQVGLGQSITEPQLVKYKSLNVVKHGVNVRARSYFRTSMLCGNKINETVLMMPFLKKYEGAKTACEHFGGNMVYLDNAEDFQQLNAIEGNQDIGIHNRRESVKATEDVKQMSNLCNYKFWTPIVQRGEALEFGRYNWYNDKDQERIASYLPWKIGQPNGLDLEKCVVLNLKDGTYEDVACSERYCGLCSFADQQKFTIRGLEKIVRHESNAKKHEPLLMDREYVFLPRLSRNTDREGNLYIRLRGYLYSEIQWFIEANTWKIKSTYNQRTVALPNTLDEKTTIGRYEWEFFFKHLGSTKTDKGNMVIKITRCDMKNQFTCDTGHCISIQNRCDGAFNCRDKSDENNCNMVFIDPKNYLKYYPPSPDESTKVLDVKVNMMLLSIEKIMEIDMTFETKFGLILEWKDRRLTYYNLKEQNEANIVSMRDRENMWIPPLLFNNTNENIKVQNDENANMVVDRMGQHTYAPIEELNENYVYSGAKNKIIFGRLYVIKQGCHFKLENYPFDTQVCRIEMSIPATIKDQVRITPGGVRYLGNEELVQFRIMKTIMISKGSDYIVVEITLRRMISYHIVSTFSPTLLLLLIGIITLFLDESHFEATIMLAITAMLVMYTLYESASSGLPKTAYLKMIDIWLIFGLVVPFAVFLVEIAAEIIRNRSKSEEGEKENKEEEDSITETLSTIDCQDSDKIPVENEVKEGVTETNVEVKTMQSRIFKILFEPLEMAHQLGNNLGRGSEATKKNGKTRIKAVAEIVIPVLCVLFILGYIICAFTYYNS